MFQYTFYSLITIQVRISTIEVETLATEATEKVSATATSPSESSVGGCHCVPDNNIIRTTVGAAWAKETKRM